MKTVLAAFALAVLAAGPAQAFHCPQDMARIDAMLPQAKLSPDKLAEVKKLRAEGEALHKAGRHQESVDTLAKAQAILAAK